MQLLIDSSSLRARSRTRPWIGLSNCSLLLLVFSLLATFSSSYAFFCPTGCTCYQRTVRCIRARLTSIPRMPQDTQVVDLRFNRFTEIPANAFADLPYVATIFLNENDISRLQEGAFDGLTSLRFLYMNNNRLSTLPANLFQQSPNLEAVYLENNELRQLESGTFSNLPRLHRLSMFNNKLSKIPGDAFNQLTSLKRLRLDGNPIECDCGIYPLWQFYQHHPERNQISISLTCETPNELYRRGFQSLKEQHFHCKQPEILDIAHDIVANLGETIILSCRMIGDPVPEITWTHNANEITAQQLQRSNGDAFNSRIELMGSGTLKINSVDINDDGIYVCSGRNAVGNTNSQPIRLIVQADVNAVPPPRAVDDPNNNNNDNNNNVVEAFDTGNDIIDAPPHFIHGPTDKIVALNGPDIVLDCVANGSPAPEIQWFFNGRHIAQSTATLRLHTNGSLVISEPITQTAAGTYRCEATNHLGSVQATARIDVRELPEILISPQSQIIKAGKAFVLECDADGNPLPAISWQLNGTKIVANERISLENENTELIVSAAQEADNGIYTCLAENSNGRTTAAAIITIERINSAPNLLIKPFDLEALDGTTIELPCKAEESEGVQITWRHDGRIIDPNVYLTEKYQISGAGSLFVKNVTIRDGGRYECSLKNNYGRATASAVVIIKNPVDLAPGDRFVRIAFEEAAKEIDLAINNTVDMLFKNSSAGSQSPKNFADLLRVFRFPTGEARQLARAAEIYERTLVNIRKHVLKGDNLTISSDKYEFRDLLSREHLHLVAELSGCMEHREMPNCTDMCYHSKYRSIDGTCNNLRHPTWGASLTAFRRIANPIYENGFSMPVGWLKEKLYAGYPKPSARLVSTSLISTKDITPDDTITHMVMQWGQFLDHDLDHAIPSVSSESWDGIDCKKTCEFAPPCYPMEVPPNDPRIKNRRCIDLVRSSSICGSGMTSVFFDSVQHREQINQLTSFIDASQVYGYSYAFAQELRNLTTDEGLLRVGVHFPQQKEMLPFAAPQDGMDCRRNLDENQMNCFVSGDIRVNEQVGLLAMHTIWMREHNRLAVRLRDVNPHWDGDTIYQEARKIVGAQMQHITYKQWLPLIIGESGMEMLGAYSGYNPQIEPTIANEFATAALRFGHTIINPLLHRLDTNFEPIPQGHLQLHKAFFAPWRIAYEGGVDPLMRGMFAVPAKLKTPQQNLNTELTEKLFQTAHAVALDLAAMNVQRGRDHGIPGYNEYRKFCNMSVATTFDELSGEISDVGVRNKLKELYGHPDNIDIWVGGILEDQVEGGKVGPLFRCLLVDQFKRLRDGDRFYYENPSVFQPEQLAQIKQANLARVLCDNGDSIGEVTENVFVLPIRQGGYKKCEDIEGINLYYWQDCGTCESMPPLLSAGYVPETYVKRKRSRRAIKATAPLDLQHNDVGDLDGDDATTMLDINEERISGLEEVVSSFQKELRKLHKKLRKLEASTCSNGTQDNSQQSSATFGSTAPTPPTPASSSQSQSQPLSKPKRSHCVDKNGTTRLNNEIWNPDVCTNCECRHGQVTCTHEKCGEISCAQGSVVQHDAAKECCPRCVKAAVEAAAAPETLASRVAATVAAINEKS